MFTSKSIFLLAMVIVLLAIAWNTDVTMVYILFVISFVMFVLLFAHLQFNIPNITVKREHYDVAYEDELLDVKLLIENKRGMGAYFFELLDNFKGALPGQEEISLFVMNMKAKERKKVSYIATCYKRGFWRLGPVKVVSQDALGFFKIKRSFNIFSDVTVYPKLFRILAFPPLAKGSVSWLGVETAKISGDSHEFFGIREYQRGDAISRIHWASSARHNKLIVKQFERNAVQEVTVIFDLKKGHDIGVGKETTLEYSVKIAGSIAAHLLKEGALVQMLGYGKEAMMLQFGKGESHKHKILEYLARVSCDGEFSLSRALEEAIFVTPHNSTLIVVMHDSDMNALSSLVQFKAKGIKLIVVVISASTFGQIKDEEYLDEEGVKRFDEALANLEAYVYRIAKGDDLEKKFEVV